MTLKLDFISFQSINIVINKHQYNKYLNIYDNNYKTD